MKLLKLNHKFIKGKHADKTLESVINEDIKYLNYYLPRNKTHKLAKESYNYITKSIDTKTSDSFLYMLAAINSETSNKLATLLGDKCKSEFINIKASHKNRNIVFDFPFGSKKNEIKLGRLTKKLFDSNGITHSVQDIEELVSAFESFDFNGSKFVIFKGDDIAKYYHYTMYHKLSGSLGNSCERGYQNLNRFDMYRLNPEVEMLTLVNDITGKITARAIIWNKTTIKKDGETIHEGKFMDRIYTNDNKDVAKFKKWADENKCLYKFQQSYSNKKDIIFEKNRARVDITNKLTNSNLSHPYMDTFHKKNYENTLLFN
jgi:hypothetical protein